MLEALGVQSYAQGCSRGEFFSPWHDGSAYQQPTPWLTWVAKAAMSVCVSAGATQGKTVRRRKVKR